MEISISEIKTIYAQDSGYGYSNKLIRFKQV